MAKQSRLKLQTMLENTLGSENVYFQPPESLKLKYPCIVYSISNGDTIYASNLPYKFNVCYQVIFMSRDPDDETRDEIAMLPMCRYDRAFKADDMNHDVFKIYV